MAKRVVRFPIYIPSLGRVENKTANLLSEYEIPYTLFVEAHEYGAYCKRWGKRQVHNLGGSKYGSDYFTRNQMREVSRANGDDYFWQLDDDIRKIYQVTNKKNRPCNPEFAFSKIEDFATQFTNIGAVGLKAHVFAPMDRKAFRLNQMIYGCYLSNNLADFTYHKGTETDLDFNLQILTAGWCTISFSIFNFDMAPVGKNAGGFTEVRDQDDRRRKIQQETIRRWPQFGLKIKPKGQDSTRLDTGKIWRTFKQALRKNKETTLQQLKVA